MALKRCVTHRAPASTAAVACSAVAGVCPSDTITPRSTSAAITSSAPGRSGAMVTSTTPCVAGPALDGVERRLAEQRLRVRAALRRRQERPLEVQPERDARPPTLPAVRPRARRAPARSRPSGVVTMVGSHAVTPNRGRSAPSSHSRSGSEARSMPSPPLHCRSMNPGATRNPSSSPRVTDRPVGEPPLDDGEVASIPLAVDEHRAPWRITSPTPSVWRARRREDPADLPVTPAS